MADKVSIWMKNFELDPRLAEGGFLLAESELCLLLLMNNKVAPWFVLVPKISGVSELYELDSHSQAVLLKEINELSGFVKAQFTSDKLNIAAIGNIVKQLHIHVVGRHEDDDCWPGVVWGADFSEPYQQAEVDEMIDIISNKLPGFSRTYS